MHRSLHPPAPVGFVQSKWPHAPALPCLEFPFELRSVNLGPDEQGYPATTCVVEWNTAGGRQPEPRKERGRSRALQVFDKVLAQALTDRGEDQGGKEWVQEAFAQAWPTKGAHRPRWADAIRAAEDLRELEVLEVAGVTFFARPEAPF